MMPERFGDENPFFKLNKNQIMNVNISIDSIIEKIKNLELPNVLKDLFGRIAVVAKQ